MTVCDGGGVAGGLAVGKEGPFVHAGAAIGALLSQVGVYPQVVCVSGVAQEHQQADAALNALPLPHLT